MKLPHKGGGYGTVSAVIGIVALVLLFYGAPVLGWPMMLGVVTGCLLGLALIVFRKT